MGPLPVYKTCEFGTFRVLYSRNPKKKTGIWAPEVPFRLQFFSLRVPVFFLRVLGISSLGAIPPQFFSLRVLEPSSVFI